ncbi:MAG: twin-arginine translocase TatA/TatE family subunit [Nocardioidaceae bacterium]
MHQIVPLIGVPQGWELILIVLVILLLFGAAKLPQLARGTGQALRIFKAETKGLRDEDESTTSSERTDEKPRGITSGDDHVSSSQPVDDPADRSRDN